ncbi:YggS family pyridoxal phosphate-dependent enzyme [candidate division WOR-3 bacterium]|nr:YggS family pyridoxal phosphate-dependent enzyme [candidate division WOR-3 bacterium]
MSIKDNLLGLEDRIHSACARAGRSRAEVVLVAVTKTRTAAEIDEAITAGVTQVGENRIQETLAKKPAVTLQATWHLVGSLQTNKAKKALELFDFIQSVDSLHLAAELQRRCEQAEGNVDVLVEVNTSGEASKHGVTPETLPDLVPELLRLDRLRLAGLMTIGPGLAIEDPEASRSCFRMLKALAEQCRERYSIPLPHLSMGMSSDFEVGIEEGATIIRIGTAIFGPRQ